MNILNNLSEKAMLKLNSINSSIAIIEICDNSLTEYQNEHVKNKLNTNIFNTKKTISVLNLRRYNSQKNRIATYSILISNHKYSNNINDDFFTLIDQYSYLSNRHSFLFRYAQHYVKTFEFTEYIKHSESKHQPMRYDQNTYVQIESEPSSIFRQIKIW